VSEFAQCFVADSVTVRVVDHFEAIKVEHQNGQPLRVADAAKTFIELSAKKRRLGSPVKGSCRGQIARFQLGAAPCFNFAREIVIATKPVNYQLDREVVWVILAHF
jgi:hypothetical protein